MAVVTRGERGSVACGQETDGQVLELPAFQVEAVDTTGCGDVFHGVYAATLAWDFPLEKRMRWASAAASLKARVAGAQKGIPTRAEVEKLAAV